jgi:hypothetical protein
MTLGTLVVEANLTDATRRQFFPSRKRLIFEKGVFFLRAMGK